jgi:hypothetical protein
LAALISCLVILRVCIAALGFALFGHAAFGAVGWLLLWIIPAYFVGFGLAGVLFAAATHLRSRVLRYSVTGCLCGSSIYGAVGLSMDLSDGKGPNVADNATRVAILGIAFGIVGIVLGVLDTWRERRR